MGVVFNLLSNRTLGRVPDQLADYNACSSILELVQNVWLHYKVRAVILRAMREEQVFGCGFFAYSWKLPSYSGAFYLRLTILAFLLTVGAFLLTILASLLTVGAFLLTVGKCA